MLNQKILYAELRRRVLDIIDEMRHPDKATTTLDTARALSAFADELEREVPPASDR